MSDNFNASRTTPTYGLTVGPNYGQCARELCDKGADGEATYEFTADLGNGRVGATTETYAYCQECFEWMYEHYEPDSWSGDLEAPDI